MTKQLFRLATDMQARLLAAGGPWCGEEMPAVLRDAWASLYRWHKAGDRVWRMPPDDEPPALAADLALATAAVYAPGCCYSGPTPREWIVVARHAAREPIILHAPQAVWAFPEAMITYVTTLGSGALAAGCLNLGETPTWSAVYLPAGRSGSRWLHQDDIALEESRLFRAMQYWYRPPAIAQ